jgi:hypothetical protein
MIKKGNRSKGGRGQRSYKEITNGGKGKDRDRRKQKWERKTTSFKGIRKQEEG